MGGWQRHGPRRRRTATPGAPVPAAPVSADSAPAYPGAYRVLLAGRTPATCRDRLARALRPRKRAWWSFGARPGEFDGSVSSRGFTVCLAPLPEGAAGPTVRGDFVVGPDGTIVPLYGPAITLHHYAVFTALMVLGILAVAVVLLLLPELRGYQLLLWLGVVVEGLIILVWAVYHFNPNPAELEIVAAFVCDALGAEELPREHAAGA
jgi:hypothetical protein